MGLIRDELLKRAAERDRLQKDFKALREPGVDATDDEIKDSNSVKKLMRGQWKESVQGVNRDVRLLDLALNKMAETIMSGAGFLPIDGVYNNTVSDETVDAALKLAWDDMPHDRRPPEPIPVQKTMLEQAIDEEEGDAVDLPVVTLPPANGETGEEIPPTIRYQALCVQAEAAGISKTDVDQMLTEEGCELDHGVIETLTLKLNDRIRADRAIEEMVNDSGESATSAEGDAPVDASDSSTEPTEEELDEARAEGTEQATERFVDIAKQEGMSDKKVAEITGKRKPPSRASKRKR